MFGCNKCDYVYQADGCKLYFCRLEETPNSETDVTSCGEPFDFQPDWCRLRIWFTPEENMPPDGKRVLLEIETGYGYRMHIYGWFTTKGWHLIRDDIKEYRVRKWRYFASSED